MQMTAAATIRILSARGSPLAQRALKKNPKPNQRDHLGVPGQLGRILESGRKFGAKLDREPRSGFHRASPRTVPTPKNLVVASGPTFGSLKSTAF